LRHFSRYAAHIQVTSITAIDPFRAILQSATECEAIDVFLLDYRLPGANALELYKDLILDSGCDIPTVLISGKGDEEIAATALKIGVFDYVTKTRGICSNFPASSKTPITASSFNESMKRWQKARPDTDR
jgi:DNA-binding NtrC family response regulator